MCNNSDIVLINPPLWYYQSIPIDLIYAAYQLDKHNLKYDIRDLNLEVLNYFFSKYDAEICSVLISENKFFDINKLQECYCKIRSVFGCISKLISPNQININYFKVQEDVRKLCEIENVLSNRSQNPFIDFFEKILPSIVKKNLKFVAFSLYHPDQIIPLLTLCKMIKKQKSTIKIHIYGNLEDQIGTKILFKNIDKKTEAELKKYFDSISFGASHRHIAEIYYDSISVENRLYKTLNKYNYEDIDIFSISDSLLKRLPKSNFMPNDILNVIGSVGCYWGDCNYCSIQSHSKYKKNRIENILDMLRIIHKNNSYFVVRFRDCCISPYDLDKIADGIISSGINLKWCCRARLEKKFNRELFTKLKNAGCIMLSFGIESFHPKTNDNMNKGIDVSKSYQIIKECYESGIAVKLTAIYGFPTETYEQSIYNLQQLCDIAKYCIDIKLNKFLLFDNTNISDAPEKYGIKKIPYSKSQKLHFICDYENVVAEDEEESKVISRYIEKLEKYFDYFISEEHLLLYLKEYGIDKCMKYIHGTNI